MKPHSCGWVYWVGLNLNAVQSTLLASFLPPGSWLSATAHTIVWVAANGLVALSLALLSPPVSLHGSPYQVKEEKLREWNVMTIPQVDKLGGRLSLPNGRGPPNRRSLFGEMHPTTPQCCWSAQGDLASLFTKELVGTWCLNWGGELIIAHGHRTLRTSQRAKQIQRTSNAHLYNQCNSNTFSI